MNNNQEDIVLNAEEVVNPSADDNTTVENDSNKVSEKQDKPEDNKTEIENKESNEVLLSTIEQLKKIQEEQIKFNNKLLKTVEKQQEAIQLLKDQQIQVLEDDKAEVEGYFDSRFENGSIIRTNERANAELDSVRNFLKHGGF